MSRCMKCGGKITYESASDRGNWACSYCGQETLERVQ
jgi:DNA-directed RNA polymerase subunit RPC12/RpoP